MFFSFHRGVCTDVCSPVDGATVSQDENQLKSTGAVMLEKGLTQIIVFVNDRWEFCLSCMLSLTYRNSVTQQEC